jgi:hypothetical protein
VSGATAELVLVSLSAMVSPTTVSFSVLALVLGERPVRSGLFFYLGAVTATMLVGVLAAFVLGDAATSHRGGGTKTWVAVFDVVAGGVLAVWAVRFARRPLDPKREENAIAQMRKVASSSAIAIFGAGASLANPGAFIPIALKSISQLDPSAGEYIVLWTVFTLMSVLPLSAALLFLWVRPEPTGRVLDRVRRWLERHAQQVAAVLVLALAIALLRNGIAGLT